jgi:hypothetical protein
MSIQCSSCKSILPPYARFCKHCGAVIDTGPNTGPVRPFPTNATFKPAHSGSTYAPRMSAEQAWGQRESKAGYAPATLDTARRESPASQRRSEPETERLPTPYMRRTLERPIRLEKVPSAENSPTIAPPEQALKVTAPRPAQQPGPRPPSRPQQTFPVTQPQQSPSVQQVSSAPTTQPLGPRLHSVQLRKLQPNELMSRHPLQPVEQPASEEQLRQATLQNLTGLPSPAQRLEVQPVYPTSLIRQEPFSLPTSLRIPSLKRATSQRWPIFEIIVAILLLIGIIAGLVLICAYVFSSRSQAPLSVPVLTFSAQVLHNLRSS